MDVNEKDMPDSRDERKRLLFVYNPNAGKGRIKQALAEIINVFSKSDYEIIIHATQRRGDAKQIATEYAAGKCSLIVCAGGDGTLDEVAGGIMSAGGEVPIGYIPCGTTNDFGYTLGLFKSPLEAAVVAISGNPFLCDIATLNGNYFTYTAAFGLFADVSYATPQQFKNVFGRLAYILNGAGTLAKTKAYRLNAECCLDGDGTDSVSGEFIYGMVANSNSVGGFRGLTGPNVILDDGLFELIMIRMPKNVADLTIIINGLLNHQFNTEYIVYRKVSSVLLSCDERIPWAIDGEFAGNIKRAEITIHSKVIRYMRNVTDGR